MAGFGLSGGESSSDSTGTTSQNQQQFSTGTGSTTEAPVNADQLRQALTTSGNLYNAYEPFSGAAGTQGLQQVLGGGQNAFGLANGAGLNQAAATLNGNFLSAGNPAFQQMANRVGAATRSTIDSGFEGAGRYGSPMAAHAQGQGVGDAIGALGYQNYGAERQNQIATLGQVPQLGQAMTAPGTAALGAAYQPFNEYLNSLSTLSPGRTVSSTKNVVANTSGTGSGSSSTNGSNFNAGLSLK